MQRVNNKEHQDYDLRKAVKTVLKGLLCAATPVSKLEVTSFHFVIFWQIVVFRKFEALQH